MILRQLKIVWCWLHWLCCFSLCGATGLASASSKQNELINILQDEGLPSIAVTYIEGGYIRYRHAFTNPQFTHQQSPISVNSQFPSRIFQDLLLTTAVLRLAELGKLSLDHSIADYLGASFDSASNDLRSITLRHLLTHTSGISANESVVHSLLVEASDNLDLCSSLRDRLEKQREINRGSIYSDNTPGEVYEYSRLGALITRCIIANLSDFPVLQNSASVISSESGMNIDQQMNNALAMKSQQAVVVGSELVQCVIGHWGCWIPEIDEPALLSWLPSSFSRYQALPDPKTQSLLKTQQYTYTSMNELTRLLLTLLQKDNTSYRGNVLTQESIDEFFVVQFPLSQDYTHRMFGLYLGEEKFKAESDELGIYTYIFLDRKDENSLIIMIPTKNNYKVQRAVAKVMAHFRL